MVWHKSEKLFHGPWFSWTSHCIWWNQNLISVSILFRFLLNYFRKVFTFQTIQREIILNFQSNNISFLIREIIFKSHKIKMKIGKLNRNKEMRSKIKMKFFSPHIHFIRELVYKILHQLELFSRKVINCEPFFFSSFLITTF